MKKKKMLKLIIQLVKPKVEISESGDLLVNGHFVIWLIDEIPREKIAENLRNALR